MKKSAFLCLVSLLTLAGMAPATAIAQEEDFPEEDTTNRPVPATELPGASELRDAIRRIARDRRDVEALIDAGNAALLLNDAEAALNFFRQADNLRSNDGRIKAGLGAALVRSENPFEGLRYFDDAVRLGTSERSLAAERGMAFDLLGNFERAQQDYQLASTVTRSDRLTVQHAISLSLSGKAFEADTLLNPLLARNDPAAWRARAFMLAARGDFKQSQEVTRGFLDFQSAQRIERYLKQMPSLTGPQQAAAIHLGHFPLNNIGRDSDVVRSVASSLPPVGQSSGSNRLIPAGSPLGSKPENRALSIAQLRIASAAKSSQSVVAVPQQQRIADSLPQQVAPPPPFAGVNPGFDAIPVQPKKEVVAAQQTSVPAVSNEVAQAPVPKIDPVATSPELAPLPAQKEPIAIAQAVPAEPDLAPPSSQLNPVKIERDSFPSENTASDAPKSEPLTTPSEPVKIAQITPMPVTKSNSSAENFDLGSIVASIEIPDAEKERQVEPVDLSKLPAAKPAPSVPVSKPAKKEVASAPVVKANDNISTKPRYWVQISTGETAVMQSEYRRLSRKHPELFKGQQGWTSPWKTISRLVVGPFDGYDSANAWYNSLKKAGGDGFVWNSAQGTEVTKLSGK